MTRHAALESVIRELDLSLDAAPTLLRAANDADEHVATAREMFAELLDGVDDNVDIVAMGSLARGEVTAGSDLDAVIMLHGVIADHQATLEHVRQAVERVRTTLGLDASGSIGTFGAVVAAPGLVHRVGLESDTNMQQTWRLLVLLESVSLRSQDHHKRLQSALLDRYLAEHQPGVGKRPRFILNDTLRYWRTLTVDYQAKLWRQDQRKWGARYLKLISTRKVLVAGLLAAILSLPDEEPKPILMDILAEGSLVRLDRYSISATRPLLKSTVVHMEAFLSAFDSDWMVWLGDEGRTAQEVRDDPNFPELVERSRALHDDLVGILHDTDLDRSKKYLLL